MNSTEMEGQEQIIALETKLSYLEDFVQKLQDVTVEHTEELERLHAENRLMARKIRELSDLLEGDVPNRKPPHY